MATLGLGIVGCGSMGRSLATNAKALEPMAKVVAVCDTDEQALRSAAEEFSAKPFADPAELLACDEVQAVVIATPGDSHCALCLQAAQAQKHVFCEKPMALTVQECDQMIAACEEAGVKLMIGHVLRYIPAFAEMLRIVREGEIGKPFAMQTTRVSSGWGGARKQWRDVRATSGGVLFEVSVHELDFMCCVLGEPQAVHCIGGQYVDQTVDYEDLLLLNISFENNGVGHLAAGLASALRTYDGKIWGTEGTIFHRGWGKFTVKRFDGEEREVDPQELEQEYGVQRELREFVEAVLEDKPVTIPGAEGRRAVAMCQAAYRSLASGRPERVS